MRTLINIVPTQTTKLLQAHNKKIFIIKRTMYSRLKPITNYANTNFWFNNKPSIKYAKRACSYIEAGTIKGPQELNQPTINKDSDYLQLQSDVSGYHKTAVVKTCRDEYQCHKRVCNTTHALVCLHTKNDPTLVTELSGALTHQIPVNKQGVLLADHDFDGKHKLQYIVTEKTAIPVNNFHFHFHKNEKASEFVQQENIAEKIKAICQ